MASVHSSVGSSTSQRTPARPVLRRKEKVLFAQESRDQGCTEVSGEKEIILIMAAAQHLHRGSTNSDESSNNATGDSSRTSKTGYRTSMELTTVRPLPLPLKQQIMPSKETPDASPLRPKDITQTLHEDGDHTSDVAVMIDSPAEIERPLSPRSHIGMVQAKNTSRPKVVYSSPLERFLAQDSSSAEFDGNQHRIEEEMERLRPLRVSTLRLRGQLRQLRKELHRRELAINSADDLFIKHVRDLRSESKLPLQRESPTSEIATLEAHYAAIQEARDEYGPIYDEYNKLEDFLDQQEFEVAKVEGRLYSTQAKEAPDPGSPLIDLSYESPPKLHPLHISYMSRLGDLDLVKERLQNMIQERENLLYAQESRLHVGMKLHEDERSFLDQFPEKEASLLGQITEIEQDVERQKEACLKEGIDLAESSLGDVDGSEIEATSTGSPSDLVVTEPSMFPLLLPKTEEKKTKLSVFITDFDETNKVDRINRWLRYQLQTSFPEVELLVRIFLDLLKIADLRQWRKGIFDWQVCVTMWWEYDEANRQLEDLKERKSNTQSLTSTVNRIYEVSEMSGFHRRLRGR